MSRDRSATARMHGEHDDIEAVAALGEPVRRALYEWVAAVGRPASRDEAAAAVGISRALAAFHLDRLVEEGLLTPEYRRLTGRSGPGAGRPAKLYSRSDREVSVSLPERQYEVAARVFADALEALAPDVPPQELTAAARRLGREVGAAARARAGRGAGERRRRAALLETLAERGYEPRDTGAGEIRLGNCPFHVLVNEHRELVCGMNLALAEGIVGGLGTDGVRPRLDPLPGFCCVALGTVGAATGEQ